MNNTRTITNDIHIPIHFEGKILKGKNILSNKILSYELRKYKLRNLYNYPV